MPNYGDPKYWENRYKNSKSTFDWLEDYNSLKSIISDLIQEKNKKVEIHYYVKKCMTMAIKT